MIDRNKASKLALEHALKHYRSMTKADIDNNTAAKSALESALKRYRKLINNK